MTVGTRWGMSPDQEQEKDCSARSDVYSLGLVTYRLLSGQMPWAASSPDGMETVNKALGHLVKREGGASVREVVMSALSTNWTDRPESCGAFVTALEEAVASDEARRRSADVARSEAACDPLSAYESFRVGEGQLELRRIGPQRFEMGSLEDDEGANDDERPQRWVTLTREFAMGVFPVTQGQYVAVMGENPSLHREADAAAHHPVENVTWFDAVRFCNKLSRLHGLRPAYTIGPGDAPDVRCDWTSPGFRLPTEAEWECAARAGAGHTLAYSGGEAPDEVAWTVENSDGETRPVGLLRPNAWGLYDMSGNVWEWVWDCVLIVGRLMPFYDEGPVTDPQGSTEGSNRVNRGGGWDSSAASARVAIRDFDDPSDCNVNLGFRIARTVHLDSHSGAKARAEAETHRLGATHAAAVAYESHQLGEVSFRLCSLGAERFWMGSEEGVGYDGERPRHEVSLRSFGIGEYLVTQGLWHAVMGSNPSFFAGARRPVEQVTWFDAVRFCNLLSEKMGLEPPYTIGAGVHPEVTCDWRRGGFRLPTEAEWECAAKGGGETQFAGSEVLDEFGWYGGNSGGQTHDVGQKRANAYGLFDASGNLWEWCWDWYAAYSGGPAHDPRGPTAGSGRVRRGGCWVNAAALARVARRLFAAPALCSNSIGFRLARTIP
jgi:formylglycine-generating enzyme required for sulfatase activity